MNFVEEYITDFTQNGACSNCGECCADLLPISSEDIKRIQRYIQKHDIKEQRHNYLLGYDSTCPFRDDVRKRCLIYEVRPAICRHFMCNHTQEDIMKSKMDMHKKYDVVSMRELFFGNGETMKIISLLFKGVLNGDY